MSDGPLLTRSSNVRSKRRLLRPFLGLSWLRSSIGRRRAFWVSLAALIVLYVACFLIPLIAGGTDTVTDMAFAPPSLAHPFGTDDLGRDMFVRTFAAGRIDITVGVVVVAISAVIGSIIGAATAMSNRVTDAIIMRVVDAFISFPYFVVILLFVVLISPTAQVGFLPRGLPSILVAFLVIGWTYYARLSRGQTLSLRSQDHIVAARLLGYSRTRVLFVHVLPGVSRVVVAYAVSDAILTMGALASFAFLGVGVQPPTPEWGTLMDGGKAYLASGWWITVFPGILLTVTGLLLSLLSDSIKGEDS